MPSATFNVTDSHYLHTLGIPLLRGRDFSVSDRKNIAAVALINQALAARYFPNQDPIGKPIHLHLASAMADGAMYDVRYTIIGVMGNIMNRGVVLPPEPQITTLFRQTPQLNYWYKNLLVRTSVHPLQVAGSIREQLHTLDPNVPFAEAASMEQIMEQQTADRLCTTRLLGIFAMLGMLLAGVGVYSVVSYLVVQRTNEIGLRIALGARRADAVWMIVKHGIGMALVGALAGLFAAWTLRQALSQLVFGISPADPRTFVAAALLLTVFATAASYYPARRAAKVDPLVALRYE
jgi:putative ABC transport system permease protein